MAIVSRAGSVAEHGEMPEGVSREHGHEHGYSGEDLTDNGSRSGASRREATVPSQPAVPPGDPPPALAVRTSTSPAFLLPSTRKAWDAYVRNAREAQGLGREVSAEAAAAIAPILLRRRHSAAAQRIRLGFQRLAEPSAAAAGTTTTSGSTARTTSRRCSSAA